MPNNDLGLMGAATSSGFNEGMQDLLKERIRRQMWAEELRKQQAAEEQQRQQTALQQRSVGLNEQRFSEDNRRYGLEREDAEAAALSAGQEKQKVIQLITALENDPTTPRGVIHKLKLTLAKVGDGIAVDDLRSGPERAALAAEEDTRSLNKFKAQTRAGAEIAQEFRPAPQAEKERTIAVETMDEQGNPVTRYLTESEARGQSFKKPLPRAGGGPIPAGMQSELADLDTLSQLTTRTAALGDEIGWKGVGAYMGGTRGQLSAQYGRGSDPREEQLRSHIGNIKGTVAKLRGGTSFTENEQKLLDTYVPDINDSPGRIQAKLTSLNEFIQMKRKAFGGGSSAPNTNSNPEFDWVPGKGLVPRQRP